MVLLPAVVTFFAHRRDEPQFAKSFHPVLNLAGVLYSAVLGVGYMLVELVFVQRFAKALAVGLSLLITTLFTDFSTIRWLSILTVIAIIVWYFAVRYAGRKFREIET